MIVGAWLADLNSLSDVIANLVQVVAIFKLSEGDATRRMAAQSYSPPRPRALASAPQRAALAQPRPAPRQVAAPKPAAKPVPKPVAIAHQSAKQADEEWETF